MGIKPRQLTTQPTDESVDRLKPRKLATQPTDESVDRLKPRKLATQPTDESVDRLKPRKLATQPTDESVDRFLAGVPDPKRRHDAERVRALMDELAGEPPTMWGPSIVGYGRYRYRGARGQEASWMRVGFSPRESALTVYCMPGFDGAQDLLARLGRHSTGAACVYLPDLDDVDSAVLRELIQRSLDEMARRYPSS
jgi:hypothetical protein